MTFSIVAADLDAREWGVAVASKFFAVGSLVGWARAGVGALATQSFANVGYGEQGLGLMADGKSADEVLSALTGPDELKEKRQVGIVDARGDAATFTGSECFDWAGGRTGANYCVQGNILVGENVVAAMAAAFESTEGDLAERLTAALTAGDAEGGDRRGRQSASLLVVREDNELYGGGSDRAFDIRVDDHPDPLPELRRLLSLHRLYFPRPDELSFVDVDDTVAGELRALLSERGYDAGRGTGYDEALRATLYQYIGTENLEERWSEDARVEQKVLEFLRATPPS